MRPYVDLLRRERDFRRVYLSQLVSFGGDWFALIPLLNLLARETGGGVWGGLVLASETALLALAAPYAGSMADRWDRRRVLIGADVLSAVVVLALLAVRGPGTAWLAVVVMGLLAVAKAFYGPASNAALPNLVSAKDLPAANVLVGASWGTMLAVGAALGGLLDSVAGPQTCFLVDSGSFAVSALLVAGTRRPFQEPRPPRAGTPSVRDDLVETVRYVRATPAAAALLTVKSAAGLGNGTLTLFPLLAVGSFGAGSTGTGLLFAARGLGALVGPLLLRRRAAEGNLYGVLVSSMVLFGTAYVLFGMTPWFGVALVLVVAAHMGGGSNWVLSSYGLQTVVPDALRGRVFATDIMLATLAMAAGQLAAGALSGSVDPRVLASGFGALTLAYAGLWWLAVSRLRLP